MEKVLLPRKLESYEVTELFLLTPEDVTLDLLEDYFAYKKNRGARFNTNDYFNLPKDKFYNNETIRTTVGKYIFNLLVLSPNIIKSIGYQNIPMNKKGIGSIDEKVSNLLLEDKLKSGSIDFTDYLDKMQWLGFACAKFLNSSLTYSMLVPPQEVEDRKVELIEKYKDAIANSDLVTVNKMEKELIDLSKDLLKDTPDYQIYDSGARGSFGNNFKNSSIMRGAIKNLSDPTDIKISTASLNDGIPPGELHLYADLLTQASHSRAVGTREGGLILLTLGSPCKTKLF